MYWLFGKTTGTRQCKEQIMGARQFLQVISKKCKSKSQFNTQVILCCGFFAFLGVQCNHTTQVQFFFANVLDFFEKRSIIMNTDKIFAQNIADQYTPKKTSKVVQLKKLHQKAKRPAEIFAFTFGIVCSLILGTGMCFAMGVLGNGGITEMIVGIVVGLLGIAGVSVNYPIYNKILNKGKQMYGSDIIRLAEEIAEEN